MANITKADTT